MSITAPHLATPTLRRVGADDLDEFIDVTLRGFHADYEAEPWAANRAVVEPGRSFGYAVDGRWISTCSVYSRVMTVPGGAVPTAAVTFVTVQPSYRRRGLLRQMMTRQFEDIVERGIEPVALLWASESSIYGRFGYGPATARHLLRGPTDGLHFRPGVDLGGGSVGEVSRDEVLPMIVDLRRSWLAYRVGALDRSEAWWAVRWQDPKVWRQGATALRFALHFDRAGRPDGYIGFRIKDGDPSGGAEVQVVEIDAANPPAYAALCRFFLDLDLVSRFTLDAPTDDPLRHLVADPRRITTEVSDGTYLRLVDVRAALEARLYAADLDVVIGVRDPALPTNDGTIRLQAGPDGAEVSTSRRKPDLTLDVTDLGASYLGNGALGALQAAGLVEERTAGSVAAVTAAFTSPRSPFCTDFF